MEIQAAENDVFVVQPIISALEVTQFSKIRYIIQLYYLHFHCLLPLSSFQHSFS